MNQDVTYSGPSEPIDWGDLAEMNARRAQKGKPPLRWGNLDAMLAGGAKGR